MGFHTFTGCDQTRGFIGNSKLSWWKSIINANKATIDAFKELGEKEYLPLSDVLEILGKIVASSYRENALEILKLSDFQWHMFSKFQPDKQNLPPSISLKYKVFRFHLLLRY